MNSKILFKILSIIVGALSLISLTVHYFDIGLNSLYYDIVEYYRNIAIKIYGFIPVDIPMKIVDLLNLSAIGAFAYVRTPNIQYSRLMRMFDERTLFKYWKVVLFVFMWLTCIGILIVYSSILPVTYLDESQDLMRGAVKNMLLSIIILMLFFVLNAFSPSI